MDVSDPIDMMARTAWGEARGEGSLGMQAVINVIMNRVADPIWWGHDVIDVCTKPWQFSCWNANDPNRAKLEAVDDSDAIFIEALDLATKAVNTYLPDVTNGADSYFDRRMPHPPAWSLPLSPVATILHHVFYKTVKTGVTHVATSV